MPPLSGSFAPVFIRNQFRTTIPLPTREKYPQAHGQTVIITGANNGLGYAAAQQMLSLGVSHLVMGVRSLEKGEAAKAQLQKANPDAIIDVWHLDMHSYVSIQAFARQCSGLKEINSVILNAGVGRLSRETVPETGHESTMQVNHYGTALLALLLMSILKAKPTSSGSPPTITVVNSIMAHLCAFPNKDARPLLPTFDDDALLMFDPNERYGVSKLISQLFLVALCHRSPPGVVLNMVDPGLTRGTDLFREASGITGWVTKVFFSAAGRPVERGAATYIDAALNHRAESHGCFLMNCNISPLASHYYKNPALTDLVWEETIKETGFAEAVLALSK